MLRKSFIIVKNKMGMTMMILWIVLLLAVCQLQCGAIRSGHMGVSFMAHATTTISKSPLVTTKPLSTSSKVENKPKFDMTLFRKELITVVGRIPIAVKESVILSTRHFLSSSCTLVPIGKSLPQ